MMLHLSASIVTLTLYQVIKLQKDGWMVTSKRDRDWVQQHPLQLIIISIISRLSDHANMTPQIIHKTASLALRYRVLVIILHPLHHCTSFPYNSHQSPTKLETFRHYWHPRFFYSYCNFHFYQLDQTYKRSKYHLNIFCSFGTAYHVKIT